MTNNLVFVRHMTRFTRFFTNLVCKKQKEVWRNKKEGLSTNLLCEFGPLSLEIKINRLGFLEIITMSSTVL